MNAYADVSMSSGRSSAALAAVALLHMLLLSAFYFGLAQPIIRRLTPPPISIADIPKPREKVTVRADAPKLERVKIQYDPPEYVNVLQDPGAAIAVVGKKSDAPAENVERGPVREPALATGVRMDPKHPLHIGPDYYPAGAVRREQQGRCVVQITVAGDGRITRSSLRQSSGFPLLDEACLNAVQGQRMIPATADGSAIESTTLLPIVWRLTGSP